jgi:hypothetical protein
LSSTNTSRSRRASSPSGRATPTPAGPVAVVRSRASVSSADVPGATPDSRPGSTAMANSRWWGGVLDRRGGLTDSAHPGRRLPYRRPLGRSVASSSASSSVRLSASRSRNACWRAPCCRSANIAAGPAVSRRAGTLTAACPAAGQIRAPARCGTAVAGRGATREPPFRRTLVLPRLDKLGQVFFERLPIRLVCVFGRHLAPQPRLCVGNPAGYIYAMGVFRSVAKHS